MKNSIFKSFRFKLILCSIYSLLLTIATEVVAYVCFFVTITFLKGAKILSMQNAVQGSGAKNVPSSVIDTYVYRVPSSGPYYDSITVRPNHFMVLLIGISIIVGIALFIVYFLLLSRKFVVYIDKIAYGINEFSNGNFNTSIKIESKDEFEWIANQLNSMAKRIDVIMNQERKNEQEKSSLITNVAHDLRTPLTSIIGYLELAAKEEDTNKQKKYVTIAYEKSRRLEKLIEDLFCYTKYSSGEVIMNRTEVDMVKFIEQMTEEFYPSFQDASLEYEVMVPDSAVMVSGDGDLLARAFANLIGNAIKYGQDGKSVRIQVTTEEEQVVILIINYGELIPIEELEHIFERFYRVENSRSTSTGGSGLGLAIAKKIILMHGGVIHARSDYQGTVFEVRLPIYNGQIIPSGKEFDGEE